MAQRNPAREIAFSLIAAVVLGGGFYLYLRSTMPTEEELRSHMQMLAAPSSLPSGGGLDVRASAAAQQFVTALREKRYRDAYALTVRAYQNAASVADFEAAIAASPYMATAKEINFIRVSQQTMTRENGETALGPVLGRGMLIADQGNIDVSVTLTPEEDTLHVLTIIGAGVPLFKAMVQPQ